MAEFVIFIAAVLFLVYLYFQDKFKKDTAPWTPDQCALASAKAAGIFTTIKEMADRRHDLECQIVDQNKALIGIIEANTRANTILAERLK